MLPNGFYAGAGPGLSGNGLVVVLGVTLELTTLSFASRKSNVGFVSCLFGVQRKMFDRKGKARNSRVAVLNVRAAKWTSVISERVCVVCAGARIVGLGRVDWARGGACSYCILTFGLKTTCTPNSTGLDWPTGRGLETGTARLEQRTEHIC